MDSDHRHMAYRFNSTITVVDNLPEIARTDGRRTDYSWKLAIYERAQSSVLILQG